MQHPARQLEPHHPTVRAMIKSPNTEPMSGTVRYGKQLMRATRYATNHDWCFRGDNTKYKAKK
jgi:hypothetical protein